MKTIEAVAKLYRGIPILETMSGFVVIKNDVLYNFPTRDEAKAFVDAWIVAGLTAIVASPMLVQ